MLPSQPWRLQPATQAVMAALLAAAPGGARFVGGCVRNALLGAPVDDIDIATVLTPTEVKDVLAAAGIAAISTGEAHGVITAVCDRKPFEIATLRRDVETDGRRAVVAFTHDWSEDAARRDFRLNALYADIDGQLHDPTGHGLADCRDGAIVFVGDTETRIREDALRILRFFRFQAWYGRTPPDPAALSACASLRQLTLHLSVERVAAELLKLLAADDPRPVLRLMAETGILATVLPEAQGLARFEALVGIESDLVATPDTILRLAALLPGDAAVAEATASRLKLSNAQRARLVEAAAEDFAIVSWMSPKAVRQSVWRLGADAFCDKAMLAWAGRGGSAVQWRALLPMARTWPRPVFPMTGLQVMAAGVPEGPLVGKVMAEVEAWWVDSDFPSDPLSLIERLKSVAQGMTPS
jgi:poly(A) polymerase